jgi:hypothetical protein
MGQRSFMFHTSKPSNALSICALGLHPSAPELFSEQPPGVYLYGSETQALRAAELDSDDPYAIFRVDVTGLRLIPDSLLDGCWLVPEAVPAVRVVRWD